MFNIGSFESELTYINTIGKSMTGHVTTLLLTYSLEHITQREPKAIRPDWISKEIKYKRLNRRIHINRVERQTISAINNLLFLNLTVFFGS